MKTGRICLGLDGLSLKQVDTLISRLPGVGRHLKGMDRIALDTGVFCDSQAIWAELLTGCFWYTNGCVGYGVPGKTLNEISVFDERHLLTPVKLWSEECEKPALLGYVPILRPKSTHRVWLGDGSLPVATVVSPRRLTDSLPEDYVPRPFSAMIHGLASAREMAEKALIEEGEKLAVLLHLLKTECPNFTLWRITIFDILSHLFGSDFLLATDLRISAKLDVFLTKLDETLIWLYEQSDRHLSIISAFSHTECKRRLNLNDALRAAGLLSIEDAKLAKQRASSMRPESAAAAMGFPFIREVLYTYEGRLDLRQTLAASPVNGCVYINSNESFEDGIVGSEDYAAVKQRAVTAIRDYIRDYARVEPNIVENPIELHDRRAPLPDFIVQADGVEFHDTMVARSTDHAKTTHAPEGFLLTAPNVNKLESIVPSEVAYLLTSG